MPSAIKPADNWSLIHYSRLLLTLGATSMSLAVSQIVWGLWQWQPLLIIALSTHLVYTTDNLTDWVRESHLLPHLQPYRHRYLWWCGLTLPTSLIGIIGLATARGDGFGLWLAGLGGICGVIIWLSRQPQRLLEPSLFYWIERLLVSLTWALTTVLVPMMYAGEPWRVQAGLAILFIWGISWALGVAWRFCSVMDVLQKQKKPVPTITQGRVIQVMQWVCLAASLLAIVDTLLGLFPLIHLTVALEPLIAWFFLQKWSPWANKRPLPFCNLLFASMILGLWGITAVHIYLI